MPTQEQLESYAAALPEIYKDILAAFPEVEPRRRPRYGLAFQSLFIHLTERGKPYTLGDIRTACVRLFEQGFAEIKNEIFVHPTELGEELITALTGKSASATPDIPDLPMRSW
jgi:hypothetical protein